MEVNRDLVTLISGHTAIKAGICSSARYMPVSQTALTMSLIYDAVVCGNIVNGVVAGILRWCITLNQVSAVKCSGVATYRRLHDHEIGSSELRVEQFDL